MSDWDFSEFRDTPEKRLWLAIFFAGISDAIVEKKRNETGPDRRWVETCSRDFREVAENAGFDPAAVSERFRAGKIDIKAMRDLVQSKRQVA